MLVVHVVEISKEEKNSNFSNSFDLGLVNCDIYY